MIAYEDLLTTPFVAGGRDARRGLDCYGLVLELHRRLGIDTPDPFAIVSLAEAEAQANALWEQADQIWVAVAPVDRIAGDVLVQRAPHHPLGHCAVYLDEQHVLDTGRKTGPRCLPWSRVRSSVIRILRRRAT